MKEYVFVATAMLILVLMLAGCGGGAGSTALQPAREVPIAEPSLQVPTELPLPTPTPPPATLAAPPSEPTSVPKTASTPTEIKETRNPIPAPPQIFPTASPIAPTSAPPPPKGAGRLRVAAVQLGIDVELLREALGPPPADIPAASRKLGIGQEVLREALGIPPTKPDTAGLPGRMPRPGGRADLATAAAQLGISIEALRRALGPPPPDIPGAARNLGISQGALREALDSTRASNPPVASTILPLPATATPTPVPPPTEAPTSVAAPTATPSPEPTPAKSPVVTGKYLLAFHACDESITDCKNPYNHQAYLAQSDDGTSWSVLGNWVPYINGSVPDVIRRGNIIYIFAGPGATKYDLATDTIESHQPIIRQGFTHQVFDYSAAVDEEGRLVLFFHYLIPEAPRGSEPGYCPPEVDQCEQHFLSATEVTGSDGKIFTLDQGIRLVIPVGGAGQESSASDQDVFFDGEQWIMYVSHGQSTSAWISPELRGTYAKSGTISDMQGGVPTGHFDPETGQYWTYTFIKKGGMGGMSVIRRAVHSGLSQPVSAGQWKEVVTPQSIGLSATHHIESPGFAVNE